MKAGGLISTNFPFFLLTLSLAIMVSLVDVVR